MSLAVLALAQPGTVIATAPTQAFILTQTRVISADLAASRIVVSRAVSPGAGSKIVASGSFVFLQRQRAVDIGLGAGGAALPTRRGVIDLVGSRLYVGTSSALIAFDLDPAGAPVRVCF
jgi:hypothetical protein